MDCDKVVKALGENMKLPLQAQEHLRNCEECQELVRALSSVSGDRRSPEFQHQITESLAAGLRAVRPMAPPGYYFAAFAGIFILVAAFSVFRLGASAFPVMTRLQAGAMISSLALSSAALVLSLVHQMVPGRSHKVAPILLPICITLLLTIAIASLFSFQREVQFWASASTCLRAGVAIAVVAGAAFWVVIRRGAILSPGMTGAATGLLSGLVGTTVLEIHCPNVDAWHILVAHLGASMLCTLAGFAIGLAAGAGFKVIIPLGIKSNS